MTLSELANFICGKVNQTETEDVTACKGYLSRRHELIWNDALWKDALVEYRQTIDPDAANYTPSSNYLPSKGVLLLPPIVHRVLGVRCAERLLNAQRPEYFYRIDYDAFAKTGAPAEYILLPPCVWEWESAQRILAKRHSSDAEASLVADLLDTDGAGVTRVTKTLDEDYKLIGTSERIDAVTKAASSASVTVGAPGLCTVTNDRTMGLTTTDVYFEASVPGSGSMDGYTPAATLAAGESAVLTPDAFVIGTPHNDPGITSSDAVPGGTDFGGTISFGNFANTISRAVPTGASLAATETNAKRRQRVRLVEIPTTATTLRVLGKRSCPAFTSDNDEAAINGMDNLLIAFGMADMLQRERQYGKARELQQEALQLLNQLRELETVQQVHHCRIIPDSGFGDDYFTGATRGFHF